MAIEIGGKGLVEVNLTIPQATSLPFDIIHKSSDGDVIDHSLSTPHMAFQSANGSTMHLDECVDCGAERIRVTIPASITEGLPIGTMAWDLIVATALGEQIRLCYGKVKIVDTYALDGE